jgi:hypothetical protein
MCGCEGRTVPFYDRGILVKHCKDLLAIAHPCQVYEDDDVLP